jgi:hypothetical protein
MHIHGGVVCSPRVWVKALLIRQNRWCSVLTMCVGQSLVNQTESVVYCAHHVCGQSLVNQMIHSRNIHSTYNKLKLTNAQAMHTYIFYIYIYIYIYIYKYSLSYMCHSNNTVSNQILSSKIMKN